MKSSLAEAKSYKQRGGVNTLSGSCSDRASGVMEESDGPQSSEGQPGRPWGPGYHVAGDCEDVMVPWELCMAQASLGIQQQEEWPSRSLVMGFLRKYHHSGLRTLQISTLPFMSNVVFHCHLPSPLKQFSGQKHKWPFINEAHVPESQQ